MDRKKLKTILPNTFHRIFQNTYICKQLINYITSNHIPLKDGNEIESSSYQINFQL